MSQVRVIVGADREHTFSDVFRIGRDSECDLVLDSGLVSRIHAIVEYKNGRWTVRDLGSTNGTFLNGQKVSIVNLTEPQHVQFGVNGPIIEFQAVPISAQGARPKVPQKQKLSASSLKMTIPQKVAPQPQDHENSPTPSIGPNDLNTVEEYVDHYFSGKNEPAGNHTQFIRSAYQTVQTRQKKKYVGIIVAIGLLSIFSLVFGLYQHQKRSNLEELALTYFNSNKQLDVQFVNLKRSIQESGVNLDTQLALMEKQRRDNAEAYDGYIRELGIYRKLNPQEQAIHDMARIFNESGFGMPASFVGEVMEKINTFWLASHRDRFILAINRAEQQGFTKYIVKAMSERGLPPEFFYLALQESDLRIDQYGPPTRWGIAKGMWQFIPSTAIRFGLKVGPRKDQRVFDPIDERHDFYKSTDAAATYLQEIYGTLAQSSGLLVMASYNWGEHRIANKLPGVKGIRPMREEIFEGIPEDPNKRNYWLFLTEYRNRMPEETKDYVLKIFSAAVIGHNPRLWGIDMDNPLLKYIEEN